PADRPAARGELHAYAVDRYAAFSAVAEAVALAPASPDWRRGRAPVAVVCRCHYRGCREAPLPGHSCRSETIAPWAGAGSFPARRNARLQARKHLSGSALQGTSDPLNLCLYAFHGRQMIPSD